MKLLYIDAGNSSIKLAYKNGRKLEVETVGSINHLAGKLNDLTNTYTFFKAVISSVLNNKNTVLLKKTLFKFVKEIVSVSDVAKRIIKTKYDLKRLGEDRVAALLYVIFINASPAVIVDTGTAITVDYLDASNNFLGGYICSGLDLEYQALSMNTQKLPEINPYSKRTDKIPLNTDTAIKMGVLKVKALGISKMIETDLKKMNKDILNWNVFLTGGSAGIFKSYLDNVVTVDNMVLKGLAKIPINKLSIN